MNIALAAIINTIRYMPDEEAERYLRAILTTFSVKRLERTIVIANEVLAKMSDATPLARAQTL